MSRQPRTVRHRWNLPEGQEPPRVGMVIRGASRAHSWRVIEIIPIESKIHANAFVGRLQPLGPWKPGEFFHLYYPMAAERAMEAAS